MFTIFKTIVKGKERPYVVDWKLFVPLMQLTYKQMALKTTFMKRAYLGNKYTLNVGQHDVEFTRASALEEYVNSQPINSSR